MLMDPNNWFQACFRNLWTPVWLDGSLPVVNSLLDSLSQQLASLNDLKPVCREVRLTIYLPVHCLSAWMPEWPTSCLSAVLAVCPPSGCRSSVCEKNDEDRDEEQRAAGARSSAHDGRQSKDQWVFQRGGMNRKWDKTSAPDLWHWQTSRNSGMCSMCSAGNSSDGLTGNRSVWNTSSTEGVVVNCNFPCGSYPKGFNIVQSKSNNAGLYVLRAVLHLCGSVRCSAVWLRSSVCRTLEVFSWRWSPLPTGSPTSGTETLIAAWSCVCCCC